MITEEKIEKLTGKFQTTTQNVVNEYFQHLFLSYFYQNRKSNGIFFKGGTALRIIYGSPRFSEDLDFSRSGELKISEIEEAVLGTLSLIEKEGIEVKLVEAKRTTEGYLGVVEFADEGNLSRIQFEISLRDKSLKGEPVTIFSDFTIPYVVLQLNERDLVEEKIQALLSRGKPRDFYDLYFMLRSNLLSRDQKGFLKKILVVLEKADIDFERELKLFLPRAHWLVIKNFKNNLKKEIEKNI